MKGRLRNLLLPWPALLVRRTSHEPRVYFGPPVLKKVGGPNLKIEKLAARLGRSLWPNVLYVVSGRPLPLPFLRFAKSRGVRIVLNQNGVYYPAWYKGDWAARNRELAEIHELADYVFYQSRFCREAVAELVRPPDRPGEILYNAVDTSAFQPRRETRGAAPLTLLFTGYFYESNFYVLKALLDAMRSFSKTHPSARLLLAGEARMGGGTGSFGQFLGALARERGLEGRVDYLGPYGQAEAPSVYARADILVHLKHNDCCPSTVLEAMAGGLPVVHTLSGGTPELVGDAGAGLEVPRDFREHFVPDPEKIAGAIGTVAGELAEHSRRARARAVSRFDINTWVDRHRTVMSLLLEGKLP